MTYAAFVQEDYPPFTFPTDGADPGDHPPMRVDVAPELTDRNRLTVLFRSFLVLPHVFVLIFIGLAAAVAILIAWFVVIITARWPRGLQELTLGYIRWSNRVTGYAFLLTDEYPPFTTR